MGSLNQNELIPFRGLSKIARDKKDQRKNVYKNKIKLNRENINNENSFDYYRINASGTKNVAVQR